LANLAKLARLASQEAIDDRPDHDFFFASCRLPEPTPLGSSESCSFSSFCVLRSKIVPHHMKTSISNVVFIPIIWKQDQWKSFRQDSQDSQKEPRQLTTRPCAAAAPRAVEKLSRRSGDGKTKTAKTCSPLDRVCGSMTGQTARQTRDRVCCCPDSPSIFDRRRLPIWEGEAPAEPSKQVHGSAEASPSRAANRRSHQMTKKILQNSRQSRNSIFQRSHVGPST
jgi:hypothetical protein